MSGLFQLSGETGIQIDPMDSGPRYLKVMRIIRECIDRGQLVPDCALPAERVLAEYFGVSRITIRKALASLAEQGLIVSRHGAGNFVSGQFGRIEKSLSRITSFSEDMAARNLRPGCVWASKSAGAVTPTEALALGLSPGSEVYRFERIRYADDLPLAVETATVPSFCLPSIEAVEDSLYRALGGQGHRPVRALQRMRAINLAASQAAQLEVEVGSAALLIERCGFRVDGKAVEMTVSLYRGDAYDFLAELIA